MKKEKVKKDVVVLEGVVEEAFPNAMFKVKCSAGNFVLATLCGKMRQNFIKVIVGDIVDVEVSPYDLTRGRIMSRKKKGQ